MTLKQVFSGLSLFISVLAFSQGTQKEVLFTVDGTPYYTDEFIRVYNKNLDLVKDDSQKDLDNYLDLFVGYKLKINKANKLGLQEGKQYKAELKSYRSQLSKNYLTDTKVTKELVEEAYTRSQKEIKASHILFLVDENAAPADTLKAYNKAIDVRKKALAGEDFGQLAAQFSEDPSAKDNKGSLGYFTVFRMVYPFESGAYNTPKGQISKPVRSRFGYHLIKVEDIRANRGDVTVAHIMIAKQKNAAPDDAAKAKTTINEIYQKLKQGENFETLAQQFSQDKSTAPAGGKLNRFSSGELSSPEFEDEAFSLKNAGDYSAPFETDFGWHIVKLIEKHPAKTFEEMQPELENRIGRDERSRLITESMNSKLRKKYTAKKEAKAYAQAVKALNDQIYTQAWTLPENIKDFGQTVLTINKDRQVPAKTFLEYVHAQQRGGLGVKPVAKQADILFERFTDEQLNSYYNDNLEKEFPEFGIIMEEYRDGLLLFDLMEKEIWEKAKTDTIGLEQFYRAHLDNYQWKERIDADIYSSTDEKMMKKVAKLLKKGKSPDDIKKELNTADKVNVMVKSGVFEEGSDVLPKQDIRKPGISGIIKDSNYYYVLQTRKVLPAGPKTLDESRGRAINDYQQYLEGKWVDDLKSEFKVSVNKNVFEQVKKQLEQ